MQQVKRKPGKKPLQISAGGLKLFSAILLLLVNVGCIVIEKGYLRLDTYTQTELLDAMSADAAVSAWVGVASVLQLLRGLAIPLFAFLLVEGFLHTGHYARYLIRVAATAVISEVPYDLAMSGKVWDAASQNPVMGTAICLVMLYCVSKLERFAAVERVIGSGLMMLCAAFWVLVLRVECGLEMVLLCGILYCLRHRELIKMLLGILVSLTSYMGPLAFVLIFLYNGQRGEKTRQYVYYALFPLQLVALWLLRCRFF